MQRSRRALLRRRACENDFCRHHLYRFSISVVIILWALVFLLNLWISHGDEHQDESITPAFNVSNLNESKLERDSPSNSVHKNQLSSIEKTHPKDTCPEHSYETSCTNGVMVKQVDGDINSEEDSKPDTQTPVSEPVKSADVDTSSLDTDPKKGTLKTEKLTRAVPRNLDEFKKKSLNSRNTIAPGVTGSVVHRMEPGGGVYNYASASKGAKVLDSNKEAKGASNILNKDKDKYLRNPCSAESKFVVIELSEETLVDTIEIANFEHYSSNLKDFELLGSQVYPTQTWVKLGNFSAGNVKHAQSFTLSEPKWVRYLKLNILSHYGSEFYCTLSSIEVYGVDAVERMLEDLISVPDHQRYGNGESEVDRESLPPSDLESDENNDQDQNISSKTESNGGEKLKHDEINNGSSDQMEEKRHQPVSRMPGDTVLKILMQKVRTLDLSLSVLERYLEEVNSRYTSIFAEIDKEMEEKEVLLEKTRLDIKNSRESKDIIAKDVEDLVAWRSLMSSQLEVLLKDNALLRSDVKKVQENQLHMESKGIAMFIISVIFGFLAIVMMFTDMVNSVYRPEKSGKFCSMKSSWFFLFLSCIVTIIILAL